MAHTRSQENPMTPVNLSATSRPSSQPSNPNQHRRDDSFDTYLKHVRQSFSSGNSRRSSIQSIPNAGSRRSSFNNIHHPELEVFTAEKYFSGTLDHQIRCSHTLTSQRKSRVSACSESSRAGFLAVKPVSSLSCAGRRGRWCFFSVFRCYCTPKSAVVEDEEDGGEVSRRIDDSMPVKRSSDDCMGFERCRRLNTEGSSELFSINSVCSVNNDRLMVDQRCDASCG